MLHSAVRRRSETPGHSLMPPGRARECWGKKVKMVGSWGTGTTRIHPRTAESRRAQSSAALRASVENCEPAPSSTDRQAAPPRGRGCRRGDGPPDWIRGRAAARVGWAPAPRQGRGREPGRVTNHRTRSPNTRQPLRPRRETGTSRGPAGPSRAPHWTKALVNQKTLLDETEHPGRPVSERGELGGGGITMEGCGTQWKVRASSSQKIGRCSNH